MKKVLFILSLSLSTIAFSQNLPIYEKTGKVTYTEVPAVEGVKPSESYKVMKDWMAKNNIKITSDVTNDNLEADGSYKIFYPAVKGGTMNEGKVSYKLQMFFKDGRYKYVVTDFVHTSDKGNGGKLENQSAECGSGKMSAKAWVIIKTKTNSMSKDLVKSFKAAMLEFQNDPARDNDW